MSLTDRTASLVAIGVLGFGIFGVVEAEPPQSHSHPAAEKSRPLADRFGDPLPPGAIRRFGTLRFRHSGIEDLAFTPDGKHLIAAGRGKPLVVFDADTGRKLRELGKDDPQYRDLRGFAISPDGKRVARCGPNVIFVWEMQTGQLVRQLYWPQGKEAVFSPDGTKVAALKETHKGRGELQTSIVVLEAAAEKPQLKIVAEKTIKEGNQLTFSFHGIAFSPDGKYLAGRYSELTKEKPFVYRASSSQVWLLDASTAARVRTFGSADVSIIGFAFQPGSGRLATYGKDGMIRFWDVTTGKEAQRIRAAKEGEEKSFSELRFSADGRRCAVLTDGAKFLTVLDTKDGQIIRRIAGVDSELRIVLALSADGKSVALASPYEECCVHVWDIASGTEHLADAGHRAAATSLSLSADGRTLTSRDQKGRQFQWDVQTGKGEALPTDRRDEIGQFIWTRGYGEKILRGPRWRMVFKSLDPAIIEIRGLDGGKLIRKWELPGTMLPIVALSPDGTQLALATQGGRSTVMLWNPEREEQPRPLPGHPDYCRELLFSHDGKRLVGAIGFHARNAQATGALWIWDTAQARLVHKLTADCPPSRLLLTADDRVLLAGIAGKSASIRAWDMDTGADLAQLADSSLKPANGDNNSQLRSGITGLALSDDERFLAVVSSWDDVSSVSVWETGSWKLLRAFAPLSPTNNVQAMVLSRDGRSLFVANSDSTILEWDVSGRGANGPRQPAGEALNRDRLIALWRTLAETPNKAYPAVWEMLDHSVESMPFLLDKVFPIKLAEEKRVRQLLAQLDSDSFAQREEASRQLLALGEQILPVLRQALNDPPSLEVKKRLVRILELLPRIPTVEQLRLLRALAVLEWSNRPEAVEHLQRLAGGAPSASLTRAAKAAWQRCQVKMVGGPRSRESK